MSRRRLSISTHQIIPSVESLLKQQNASPSASRKSSLDSSSKECPSISKQDAACPSAMDLSISEEKLVQQRTRELLRRNIDKMTYIRDQLAAGRKQKFYFLTVPGIIRIIEVLLGVLHIAVYCFYCTFHEQLVKVIVPPFFTATTRETFFLLANYHTLLGSFTIVISGIFIPNSNTALLASLYLTIFDFFQFLCITASSITLLQFYLQETYTIQKVMPDGFHTKKGIAISGTFLAILHLIGLVYDLKVFLKRENFNEEQINIDEEGNMKDDSDEDDELPVLTR